MTINKIPKTQLQKGVDGFYKKIAIDPLFAAEGLDLNNAALAIENLDNIAKKLQIVNPGINGKIHFLFNPLNKVLHPIHFLRNFIACETARRDFLNKPTLNNAEKLIDTHLKTQKALINNLKAYRKACLNAQSKTPPSSRGYHFYSKVITFDDYIKGIDLMIKNAEFLRNEINLNQKILEGKEILKSTTLLNNKLKINFPIRNSNKLNKREREIISWIVEGRDFMLYIKNRFGKVKTDIIGPVNYSLPQFDMKTKRHKFFVAILRTSDGSIKYFFPFITDHYHFIELSESKYKFYADRYSYEPLIKKGIKYWYQTSTSYYFTSDLTYYPDLTTIADLYLRPQLNKQAVINQKSSLLDALIWNAYFHGLGYYHITKSRLEANKKMKSWHYLLIGRSYPSLLYLPFNKSVWRLKESPEFLGSSSPYPKAFLNFNQLPRSLKKADLRKIFYGGIIRAKTYEKNKTSIT